MTVPVTAALLLGALWTSGASASASKAPRANAPYVIGFTSGLTGQFGAVGQGVRNGAEAYFNKVNKGGGVHGHQIKFIALDDALNPNTGVANFIQLVTSDHAIGVIGFHDSVVADAVAPYAKNYKVPMIAATVDQSLVQPVLKYVFAVACQTADYAAAQVSEARSLMKSHHGKVRVAIITTSDSTALQEWSNDVNSMTKKLGWDVVANVISPQDAVNAGPGITKIIAAKPTILIMALGTDPFLISAMKQLQQAGSTFPVVEYDAPAWTTLQSIHSKHLYYVSAIAFATRTATPQFYAAAVAQHVSPNAIYVSRGYLEAKIIVTALTNAKCGNSCTGSQLDAAIQRVSLVSADGLIQGGIHYSASNHQAVKYMAAFQWRAGAKAPVKVSGNLTAGTKL
jgi:ABC-type branched-subunit amino acid transport system substrate-binding protein